MSSLAFHVNPGCKAVGGKAKQVLAETIQCEPKECSGLSKQVLEAIFKPYQYPPPDSVMDRLTNVALEITQNQYYHGWNEGDKAIAVRFECEPESEQPKASFLIKGQAEQSKLLNLLNTRLLQYTGWNRQALLGMMREEQDKLHETAHEKNDGTKSGMGWIDILSNSTCMIPGTDTPNIRFVMSQPDGQGICHYEITVGMPQAISYMPDGVELDGEHCIDTIPQHLQPLTSGREGAALIP